MKKQHEWKTRKGACFQMPGERLHVCVSVLFQTVCCMWQKERKRKKEIKREKERKKENKRERSAFRERKKEKKRKRSAFSESERERGSARETSAGRWRDVKMTSFADDERKQKWRERWRARGEMCDATTCPLPERKSRFSSRRRSSRRRRDVDNDVNDDELWQDVTCADAILKEKPPKDVKE